MTDGRGYELADATYPLPVDAGVTIPEEIRCLVDAGWAWDGNKLVHPEDKSFGECIRSVDSSKIGDARASRRRNRAGRARGTREEQRMRGGQ